MKTIENLVKDLTDDQKQLLKDIIRWGAWGAWSSDFVDFVDEDGNLYGMNAFGYCTNDAKDENYRAIYTKLCCHEGIEGEFLTHYPDWWGDDTGDMLFIREDLVEAFEAWARR